MIRCRSRCVRASGDERGTVLILVAAAMSAVLGISAMVMDLELRRISARHQQAVADFAALAAGDDLDTDPVAACRGAIEYVNANISDAPDLDPVPFCAQAGNDVGQTVCSGGALGVARPQATSGRYTVSVRYPVLASEIADGRLSSGAGMNDGFPCQRMRVVVSMTNPSVFGRLFGAANVVTTRSAVVKVETTTTLKTPVLWLLDPVGCVALKASGGTTVNVGSTSPTVIPGLINIDSDGSTCSSNTDTIVSTGAGTRINAIPTSGADVGAISLHALPSGSWSCIDPACSPADVAGGRITPQPVPVSKRATRALVDWRYDCKTGYPDYHGIDIEDCSDTATVPPYVTNLRGAIGPSGQPSGYSRWTSSGYSCNPSGNVTVPAGNWWIDCPSLGIGNGTTLTFTGGNIVTDGGISMTSTSSLVVNAANPDSELSASCQAPFVTTPCLTESSSTAAFLYMRSGDLTMNGGSITLNATTVFQESGYLKLAGGANPGWSAPTEGPFAALSLWSELSSSQYQVNGGAGMALSGIFFTPEASPFSIAGGSPVSQQHAQFISYQLAISGGGTLNLAPDPHAFIQIPPQAGVLIR
jgi:hypothetical protein